MEARSIYERLQTVKCKYKGICADEPYGKCLKCANNKDEGESFFIDKETYAWYKKIRGE